MQTKCIIWNKHLNKDGYGQLTYKGKTYLAHRFHYELIECKIPKNKELDHLCRNRSCINPNHLEIVSHKENMNRGIFFNSLKTKCSNNHEFNKNNTRISKTNKRFCRICDRKRKQMNIKWADL